MMIVFDVLTFSTSSGSMQTSCSERFKGIALIFKGEVEPEGLTRTFISSFSAAPTMHAGTSRKQSKGFSPKLNTTGAEGCGRS